MDYRHSTSLGGRHLRFVAVGEVTDVYSVASLDYPVRHLNTHVRKCVLPEHLEDARRWIFGCVNSFISSLQLLNSKSQVLSPVAMPAASK